MCSACFIVLFKQKTAYELRISDWSSDVCSSDLLGCPTTAGCTSMLSSVVADSKSGLLILPSPQPANIRAANAPKKPTALTDRQSVVSGQSVSVRVDLGGRRIIKKKNTQNHEDDN